LQPYWRSRLFRLDATLLRRYGSPAWAIMPGILHEECMGDRRIITVDEAIDLIAKEPHSFVQAGPMILGCDLSRETAIERIRAADTVEIAGPGARRMGHGLGLHTAGRVEFLSTDEVKLDAFDPLADAA
jgi:hypothetical protein